MEFEREQIIAYLKDEVSESVRQALEEALAASPDLREEMERSRDILETLEAASEKSVAARVRRSIDDAVARGASDIHLVPGREETALWFRVDGTLLEVDRFPVARHQAVVDRWKVLAGMSVSERRAAQAGRSRYRANGNDYDLRVSIVPTATGERVTARLLERGFSMVLDRLGLLPAQREAVGRLVHRPNGIVLTTGPDGSGRTTVLYSVLLDILGTGWAERKRGVNVCSVEDPVEVLLEGASQIEVNRRTGLTAAAALRTVLRSDPDVVMVGDLTDPEVAELFLHGAETGHLMLSSVPSPNAAVAALRLTGMGMEPYRVADVLAGVIGLRLVRMVCEDCRAEHAPAPQALAALGMTEADGPFHHGTGCPACRGTGYRGRTGIFEVLEKTPEVARLLQEGATADELWRASLGRNAGSLLDAGREKVRQGVTTAEEVARVLAAYPHI